MTKKFIKKLLHEYKVKYEVTDFITNIGILDEKNNQKHAALTGKVFKYAADAGCSDLQLKLIVNCIEVYKEIRNED